MTSVALSQLFFFGATRRRPQWAPRKLLSSGAYSKIPFLDRVYLRAHTVWWPAEESSQKKLLEPRSTLASECHTSCAIRQLATHLPDSITHITYLTIFSVSCKIKQTLTETMSLWQKCLQFCVHTGKGKEELLLKTIYVTYIWMDIQKM